ncbi:hypothetical protein GCM10022403_005170 [Streptomyces coacervatus]|uniref:Uncharacterized protein n=1 Tax=Streptomyces coacervatus TaxID=647381 RepID=A0ABP7GR27_9ACTN|nr:hypothetical protein [Streptomyces coacervatus]MDF2264985.1 hypothetical protein [Streptomyces coacervatus]
MMGGSPCGLSGDGQRVTSLAAARARARTSPAGSFCAWALHTLDHGRITGMVSVNASTGQVWYHSWHGTFVAMS